ncbi:MAG: carboxypeptidase-like regulatory domain-containing protein [Gemmatimonadaceae bacterium]
MTSLAGSPVDGQSSPLPSRVRGRIISGLSNTGVSAVRIVLALDGRTVTTDTAGRFVFPDLPAGPHRLYIRAIGFRATQIDVDLKPGDDVERTVPLDPVPVWLTTLDPMVTEGEANYRMRDFERRRRSGRGQYVTDEEIHRGGFANLQDATRGMRGLTLHCGGSANVSGGSGCRIQVTRAPKNCQPQYIVDGRGDNSFGPLTPIRDIVGIEIYLGPSDVPGEFAGSDAGCGVVAVWTRSGPPRRPP